MDEFQNFKIFTLIISDIMTEAKIEFKEKLNN